MKLLRAPLAALSLLFLALGAAAGVVSVPARLAVYQAGLTAYNPSAATKFLADDAAQARLRDANPAMLLSEFQRAHEILELRTLPAQYEDPANLRRALIARDMEPSFEHPADLRGVYEAAKLTPADRRMVIQALAEWRTLDLELRGWLAEAGASEAIWKGLSLEERANAVIAALREHVLAGPNLALDGEAYRRRLEEFAKRAAPFMSATEDYKMDRLLERHEALAKDLRRARRAARAAEDEVLQGKLGKIAYMGEVDAASAKLEKLSPESMAAPPPVKIRKRDVRAIAKRLPDAIKLWAAGTPAEAVLEKALEKIVIDKLETALGGYENKRDRLVVSADYLGLFLHSRGKSAKEMLADPALLSDFALEIAPLVVHETTHRLQRLAGDRHGLTPADAAMLYGQEDEREAFTVQELFVRAFAAKNPERAAAMANDDRLSFIWKPETIAKTIVALPYGYSNVPAAHGSRARAVTLTKFKAVEGVKKGTRIDTPDFARRQLGYLDRFNAYLDEMEARLKDWTRLMRRAQR